MSECQHENREPNPMGGAWWCPKCGAYPLIGPTAEQFKARWDAKQEMNCYAKKPKEMT